MSGPSPKCDLAKKQLDEVRDEQLPPATRTLLLNDNRLTGLPYARRTAARGPMDTHTKTNNWTHTLRNAARQFRSPFRLRTVLTVPIADCAHSPPHGAERILRRV